MTIVRTLRIGLLIGALCSMPGVTNGQALTEIPVPEEQQAVGWIFTPSVRFGGAWDNNILLANPGDDPPGDYATPLNPSVHLDYRGRRTRLSTGYEGAFLLYRNFDELNSAEQHAHARFEYRMTARLTVFGTETFSRVPTSDALLLAGVPFYRVGSRVNEVGGGMEAQLTRHLSLRGKYGLNQVDFADDSPAGADLQGGHVHEIVAGVDRALSPRLTISAEYEARRAVVSGGLDQFDSNSGSMGVQYEITPVLTVSGFAGLARLNAGLGHDARFGPAVRAAIVNRIRRLVLSALYSRSFIPSFGFGGTYQNEEWQGNAHIPFARNRGYLDGSVARFDADPLQATQPSLRTVWVSGTVGYRLTRWLACEGYYGHSQQDSQRAGGDLGRHQVGFRMRAAKPMRLAK
jgi:hypothetical protein